MKLKNVLLIFLRCLKVRFIRGVAGLLALILGLMLVKLLMTPLTAKGDQENLYGEKGGNEYYLAYGEKFKEARIIDLITRKAKEYGVNSKLAICIARKESINFNTDVLIGNRDGDNHLTCKLKWSEHYGKPIDSRGMWQWNECAHPNLPDVDAYSIDESTELAMAQLKINPKIWSTYKDCN